ncbi:hypothetical protein M413DRAFT_29598 [Hebeloma cylindrosporum]|uniref:Uncharacterized protein n=1 Tax=Hebeloma cylindrosporum TaxID=76867 RepID=A0A0C3BQU4_HEBCY|nr:hypothetical protein M413DRAFT_29598 [Hebeloma cylindrosporum h7]
MSGVYFSPVPGALKIMSSYDRAKKVKIHQHKGRVAFLRRANKEANSQHKHMERVLADHKKPEHAAAIHKAFGKDYNLTAIKENVNKLKKGTLLIKDV